MNGHCHRDNLRILLINRDMSYIVSADQTASVTIKRVCVCVVIIHKPKDGCCHGDNLLIKKHKPYLLSQRLFGLL